MKLRNLELETDASEDTRMTVYQVMDWAADLAPEGLEDSARRIIANLVRAVWHDACAKTLVKQAIPMIENLK